MLSDEQKARLYDEWWEFSPVGRAIVTEDFRFDDVNEQLCIYLGITKAELLGTKFTDITPEPIRTIDAENARLVIEGKMDRYELPKMYKISKDALSCYVILKTIGVRNADGSFLCFDVKILEITREDYLKRMKTILKNHVLLPGQKESQSNILRGLIAKFSAKDLIELGWRMGILLIVIWILKMIPKENLPDIVSKLLQ